jgi:hypothetical protein
MKASPKKVTPEQVEVATARMVNMLLRVREAPGTKEIDHRVGRATEDFLRLYCEPKRRSGHITAPQARRQT